jgi:hypothetical protein
MRRSGPAATVLAALMSLVLAGAALGVTWAAPVTLVPGGGDSGGIGTRALATSGGTTHVVYHDDGILYRRSTTFGGAWSRPVAIALPTATTTPGDATIAAYRGLVVVAYTTARTDDTKTLWVRRSIDAGLTWQRPIALQSFVSDDPIGDPSIAIASSGVHVAWTDGRTGRIWYRRSLDSAASFAGRVALAMSTRELPGATWFSGAVKVAASGTRVYVAWSRGDAADDHCTSGLAMRRSTNGGASFLPEQLIDRRAQSDIRGLSASGSVLLASYALCDHEVVVARSADGGVAFARTIVAGATGTVPYYWTDVHVTGTTARLVYSQLTIASPDKLWLRTSTDGGVTWPALAAVASATDLGGPSVIGSATTVLVSYGTADYITGDLLGVYTRKGTLP